MVVSELQSLCDNFRREHTDAPPLEVSLEPWKARERHSSIPHGDKVGVYTFALPCPLGDPSISNVSHGSIVYIGKADAKNREPIASRVWSAFGNIYPNKDSNQPYSQPPFPMHRWHSNKDIPNELKDLIARGDISVYTIKVGERGSGAWPGKLEAYLLHICYKDGGLPLLNKVLPSV